MPHSNIARKAAPATRTLINIVSALFLFAFAILSISQMAHADSFISQVAADPVSGNVAAGQSFRVLFGIQAASSTDTITVSGPCTVNGKDVSSTFTGSNGSYSVTYAVDANDPVRAAGTVPVSCSLTDSQSGAVQNVTSFTDNNQVSVNVASTNPPHITAVSVLPSDAALVTGGHADVYLQATTGQDDLTLDGACTVNGSDVSGTFVAFGNALYRVRYTVAAGDPSSAAGQLPINCTVKNSSGQTENVHAFNDNNTVTVTTGGQTVNTDTTALYAAISAAQVAHDNGVEGTTAGQYAIGSKATLQAAIDAAQAVYANSLSTQADIDAATARVNSALSAFQAGKVIASNGGGASTTALFSAITSGMGLHDSSVEGALPGQYAAGSRATLLAALVAANAVGMNTLSTQAQVDAALASVNAAIASFQAGKVAAANTDTSALSAAITTAQTAYNSSTEGTLIGQYPTGSRTTLLSAINAAQTVASNSQSTQAQIDAAVTAMNAALSSFLAGKVSDGSLSGTVNGQALAVTSIVPVSTTAIADGTFAHGWKWIFNITVPENETSLKMKFGDWTGGTNLTIPVGGNLRISSTESSTSPVTIGAANAYSAPLALTGDRDQTQSNRQIQVIVEMSIPTTASSGTYSTNYGIQSAQ